MSTVETRHPLYIDRNPEWMQMRDCARGPTRVRAEGIKYLPMPSGFTAQPDGGNEMYSAYKTRGRFPDVLNPTVRGMVGIIHRKEVTIEMPKQMEPLWERATKDGLPLEGFHRRITSELLLCGRYGVLTDAPEQGADIPYLAGYVAETILNWANDGTFFVLDESDLQRDEFVWTPRKQFRVLELVDGRYQQRLYEEPNLDAPRTIYPSLRGNGGGLDKVPFVIMSAHDLQPPPREIPLYGVANASVAIYQLDADYRHQLYMSGQETFIVIGADDPPPVVGASIRIALPVGGDAKYVGPSGAGIAAHRTAIQDAENDAVRAGAALFDTATDSTQESGDAKKLRYAAQTATLTTIAQTSAAGLEQALRNVAMFMGIDPELVTVTPDLRFIDTVMTPQEGESLMRMWMGGAISKQTMYENLQRGDIASQDRTFEEEEELIEADEVDKPSTGIAPTEDEDEDEEEAAPGTTEEGA